MNIQLMSDLHLEVNPDFRATPHPSADVLVLAGDIGSYQPGSALAGLPMDFGLSRFSPVAGQNPHRPNGWPTPVIFVPGNHEFDGQDHDSTRQHLAKTCNRLGIVLLDDGVHVMGSVRFIGSTLWSDFDALGGEMTYKPRAYGEGETRRLRLRAKAFSAANHYLAKFHSTNEGLPLMAEQVRELSLASQAWLTTQLHVPHPQGDGGKTVVVTHFAPSLRSHDPRYGLQPGTCGFCNAMDDLLPLADAWLHGHLHSPSNYRVGKCQVRANPLGYASSNEQRYFDPHGLVAV